MVRSLPLILLLPTFQAFFLPPPSLGGRKISNTDHRQLYCPPRATVSRPEEAKELAFDADEAEAVFGFERRLKDAGIQAPGLEHALFWPEGDFAPSRGLRATMDILPGKTVIELPRNQAICLDEDEKTPFAQWVPEKQWNKMPWYARLGLKLVYERKMSTSPLKTSYAGLLPAPKSLPTPYHWAASELEDLRRVYPALANRVDRQRKLWSELYDALGKTRALREDMDEDIFVWAMESVLSRAFKGTFGTGFRSLLPSLLLTAFFAAVYYIDQESIQLISYVIDEYPPSTMIPAGLTLLPLVLEYFKTKGTYILAPMVDSLNHKTTMATDLDYDSVRQRFRLTLGGMFSKGEQVFMSYGAKSNDDLVLYYGFVEEDNPADLFEFGDMLTWLTENRAEIVNDDRLQTLFSKGLQDAVRSCKIGRKGQIKDSKALEGLRVLLASDDELRAENAITESIIQTPMFLTMDEFQDSVFSKELKSGTELAVYEALLDACKEQRETLRLSPVEEDALRQAATTKRAAGGRQGSTEIARLLTLAFRKEKIRVLDEAIKRFSRLTGVVQVEVIFD